MSIEIPKIVVFAGVSGAGKTSMMGAWHSSGEMLETTLTDANIDYIREKHINGYRVVMYYIGLNTVEEHIRRITNRICKDGRPVDISAVKTQFANRWEALNAVLPFCHTIYFMDNEDGFCRVGSYCGHTFSITDESCQWLQEFISNICFP